jgi:hypothetical protein
MSNVPPGRAPTHPQLPRTTTNYSLPTTSDPDPPNMADSVPTKLKAAQITPFAKRAAQLERFKPIVTYWCKFIAMQYPCRC